MGNPQEILKSLLSQKRSVPRLGPRSEQQPKKGGPNALTTELVTPPAFEIKSYSLVHAYNRNLKDQEGNATYLSPPRRCEGMILQPLLKVSLLDASIYSSSASVDLDLMWWKPQPQTVPPHAKLWKDLGPSRSSSTSMRMSSTYTTPLNDPSL